MPSMTVLINEEFYLVGVSIIFFWKWILRASLIILWFCFHYHLEIEAWDGPGDYNDLEGEIICQNYGRFYNFMVYSIKKYIISLYPVCCILILAIVVPSAIYLPDCRFILNSPDINSIHIVVSNEEKRIWYTFSGNFFRV